MKWPWRKRRRQAWCEATTHDVEYAPGSGCIIHYSTCWCKGRVLKSNA